MDQHSLIDDRHKAEAILEGHARECYGRVAYSHKTHEKCADILLTRLGRVKLIQIALSGATTAGFVSIVFGAGAVGAVIGVTVSALLLAVNAYTKDYDLGELAQKHRQAATELWVIRERYLALLVDVRMGERPLDELLRVRDKLLDELHAAYVGAPSTNFAAYKKAQKSLRKWEDMTFSDGEIDAFLPQELKRNR